MCPQACSAGTLPTLAQIQAALKTDLTFEHQPDAVLNQANPVQNTWYTVLNAVSNVKIYFVTSLVDVANETIELRITVDGNIYTVAHAHVFTSTYYWYLDGSSSLWALTNMMNFVYSESLEGRIVTIEIRKTTNTGNGNLHCIVTYSAKT